MNLKTSLAIFLLLTLSVNSKFVIKKRNDIMFFPSDMTSKKTFHFLKSNFMFELYYSPSYIDYDLYLTFKRSGVLCMKKEGNENPDAVEKGDYVLIVNRSMKVFYGMFDNGVYKKGEDLYEFNLNANSITFKHGNTLARFNLYTKFYDFDNDMDPMEINLNMSSNYDILKKMETIKKRNVFPVLPEMENKFLSSDREMESVSDLFNFTIRNYLYIVQNRFVKGIDDDDFDIDEILEMITNITNTLSDADLTEDYTPIFTSESVSNLFKEMMQDQELNLMVEISKFLYDCNSDQKLFFEIPKEIDGEANEDYSEEDNESQQTNNMKIMMKFITVKMMEFYVKKNNIEITDFKDLTMNALGDKLDKFTDDLYFNINMDRSPIRNKIFMFTSPEMLEVYYWVNIFSVEFETFLGKYMSETYEFQSLPNMIRNPKDYSFNGEVLVNTYMKYYKLDLYLENNPDKSFKYLDEEDIDPGVFEVFVYKEDGTEDEEFVDESNQYEEEGSGQDDVDGSQMADDLRRIIL